MYNWKYLMSPKIKLKSTSIISSTTSKQEFIDILLDNRQITDNKDAFFSPKYPQVSDFDLDQKKLTQAANRLKKAIKNQENILIYGDYDVDGITSTAVLWQALHHQGAKVIPFVPNRERDGYGIKAKSFFDFQEKNSHFDLLVTVDNGIVAHKEINQIVESGTEVIIVDHHLALDTLPKASTIVHSTQVSASILSWFLAKEIDDQADISLAALGAVADCVPLVGINRQVVVHGLKKINTDPSFGLKKLIEISNIKSETISTYELSFVLGPRINAVGRLSDPTDALRLLCSQNLTQATKFAQSLDKFNRDRQVIQLESLKTADEQNKNNQDKLIFVSNKDYLPGIIGLIAGRLTEKFHLPSIIISIDKEFSKASCRSIPELNIVETLRSFDDDLVELGGHAGAAGFTIKTENIESFKTKVIAYINKKLAKVDLVPTIDIDVQMELSAANLTNCKIIDQLKPFGIGNPEPLFLFKNLKVTDKRLLGSQKEHLKLKFGNLDAIAFKKGDLDSQIAISSSVDIIAFLSINAWNGNVSPQLMIKEIFPI